MYAVALRMVRVARDKRMPPDVRAVAASTERRAIETAEQFEDLARRMEDRDREIMRKFAGVK